MKATGKEESLLQAAASKEQVQILEKDQRDIEKLYEVIRKHKARLVAPTGEEKILPDSLHAFLVELIAALTEGQSVYIIQNQAKLTTVEAAAMLGVSRQFLINLLQKEEIPYHKVGTHRRVYAQDLLRYKAQRDERRQKAIRELAQAEASEGLYYKIPPSLTDAD